MINNPVVSAGGGSGHDTVQVPKNTIVRVSGQAKGNFSANGEYTFVCGNELADFAMSIYGNVDITGM